MHHGGEAANMVKHSLLFICILHGFQAELLTSRLWLQCIVMPHTHAGQLDTYWQFMLKPWDVAAGVCILEEAGGRVSTCDGLAYSVFDQSLLATNDALYEKMLGKMEPAMESLRNKGVKLGPANMPKGYRVRSGAQLE